MDGELEMDSLYSIPISQFGHEWNCPNHTYGHKILSVSLDV